MPGKCRQQREPTRDLSSCDRSKSRTTLRRFTPDKTKGKVQLNWVGRRTSTAVGEKSNPRRAPSFKLGARRPVTLPLKLGRLRSSDRLGTPLFNLGEDLFSSTFKDLPHLGRKLRDVWE